MHPKQPHTTHSLLVACLCADWCGTCREYRPLFTELQREFLETRFVWLDVEDNADLVDPVEVDNFPTLLIASHGEPVFFGTVTPHLDTLRRLIKTHQEPGTRSLAHASDLTRLIQNLQALPQIALGD